MAVSEGQAATAVAARRREASEGHARHNAGSPRSLCASLARRDRVERHRRHIRRFVGSFQELGASVVGARHPTIHRPPRPARRAGRPGRPRRQPALVLAPGDPGRLPGRRPRPVGVHRPRPGHAARRRRPGAARRAGRATTASSSGCGRPAPTSSATSPATAGTSAGPGDDAPRAIAYFSPEFGITAVLPQYSGGLGILAGDHLKAASDLGVPIIGVGLLYRHGYFKQSLSREGWQQETYPVLDPDGLPISLLREADGSRDARQHRPARRPRAVGARSGWPSVGRVPLLMLDTDVEGNPDHYATSPTGCTAATASTGCARSCCSASAASARCAPTPGSPAPRSPRCSTPTRATPASSASSGSASSPSRATARASTSTPRSRSAAPPPSSPPTPRCRPASTGSRATLVEQYFGDAGADARRPGRPDPRARHRGLRRRRRRRVQHGGDGLPARPARQRRLAAARRRQPRHVQRPVAGLRRGRGADRLDHQRRARPDLGGPRGLRAGRGPGRRPRLRRHRRVLGRRRQGPRPRHLGGQAGAARAPRRRRPPPAGASRGRSAARPRPSWLDRLARSTPTC